ncbi:unnamed protein product [Cylicostephanus goldi]|uniref:Uncharacterized protein n=1 Tax=Cylicostephanus goldi TaxID=71465 RepID=A0A3P6S0L8_CYLGO|nr:unnamed protein product [Cylicostephanus goldi]
MNMSSASVPRAHRHHNHHHRQQQQHNVALFGSPGPATMSAPATPKGRQEVARRQARRPISFNAKIGANSCYAGSNSMSSGSSVEANSDMETSSICSSAPSLSDVGEMSTMPTTPQKSALRPPSGMRVHPLRLIAAVAAS